jgi:hypothetical protein
MSNEKQAPVVRIERWEDEDWIITVDGAPTGRTLSRKSAQEVFDWLPSALGDLRRALAEELG